MQNEQQVFNFENFFNKNNVYNSIKYDLERAENVPELNRAPGIKIEIYGAPYQMENKIILSNLNKYCVATTIKRCTYRKFPTIENGVRFVYTDKINKPIPSSMVIDNIKIFVKYDDQLRAEKKCYLCGDQHHLAKMCPNNAPQQQQHKQYEQQTEKTLIKNTNRPPSDRPKTIYEQRHQPITSYAAAAAISIPNSIGNTQNEDDSYSDPEEEITLTSTLLDRSTLQPTEEQIRMLQTVGEELKHIRDTSTPVPNIEEISPPEQWAIVSQGEVDKSREEERERENQTTSSVSLTASWRKKRDRSGTEVKEKKEKKSKKEEKLIKKSTQK